VFYFIVFYFNNDFQKFERYTRIRNDL